MSMEDAPGSGGSPEQGMAQVPFSEIEHGNLYTTARVMWIAGIVALVGAATGIAALLGQALTSMGEPGATGGLVVSAVVAAVEAVAAALLGAWLIKSSRSLDRVVHTDESDQTHLVDSLRNVRNVFLLKAIYVLILLLLPCLVGGGMAALRAGGGG